MFNLWYCMCAGSEVCTLLHVATFSSILAYLLRHFRVSLASLPLLAQPVGSLPIGTWSPASPQAHQEHGTMPEVSSHTAGDVLTVKGDNLTQIECQTLWAALKLVGSLPTGTWSPASPQAHQKQGTMPSVGSHIPSTALVGYTFQVKVLTQMQC